MSPKIPFPPKLVVNSITDWTVFYFKDKALDPGVSPHNYFVVPTQTDEKLIICIVTSQIEKRERYYETVGAQDSLVYINCADMPGVFTKACVIDCNQPQFLSRVELEEKIDTNFTFNVKERIIKDNHKKMILDAINRSKIVDPYIKKQLPTLP